MIHARTDYDRIQDPEGLIPSDEPVFLLRAKDQSAPDIVAAWAERHMADGGSLEVVRGVKAHAMRMRNWQQDNGSKLADVPEGAMR